MYRLLNRYIIVKCETGRSNVLANKILLRLSAQFKDVSPQIHAASSGYIKLIWPQPLHNLTNEHKNFGGDIWRTTQTKKVKPKIRKIL